LGTTQQYLSPDVVSGLQAMDAAPPSVDGRGVASSPVARATTLEAPHVPDAEATAVVHALAAIAGPLSAMIPGSTEVVVQDLSTAPGSVVAVGGDLTESRVGDPASAGLLATDASGQVVTRIGYAGKGRDGRELHCSTIVVPGRDGRPVAALGVYRDVREWRWLAAMAASMIPAPAGEAAPEVGNAAASVRDVDGLAYDLLNQVIRGVDVPVELMHKRHKMAVVAGLKERGFFILRESVDRAAAALKVSRFTIYNYLKELDTHQG